MCYASNVRYIITHSISPIAQFSFLYILYIKDDNLFAYELYQIDFYDQATYKKYFFRNIYIYIYSCDQNRTSNLNDKILKAHIRVNKGSILGIQVSWIIIFRLKTNSIVVFHHVDCIIY